MLYYIVNGTYSNTGFFLKAKDENDNYIAFYSSDWSNASQRPMLIISTCEVNYAIEDVNQDGRINQIDLDIIQNSLNTNSPCQRCDVNTDGIVDIYDVLFLFYGILIDGYSEYAIDLIHEWLFRDKLARNFYNYNIIIAFLSGISRRRICTGYSRL